MRRLVDGLSALLTARDIGSIGDVRGLLSQCNISDLSAFERASYVEILRGYKDARRLRT
jgi:hypothetical protein